MEKLLMIVFTIFTLTSCQSNQKRAFAAEKIADSIEDSILEADSAKMRILLEVYEGILPCADCEGIKTKIKFYMDTVNTYVLEETYMGRNNNQPFISNGKYNVERGYEKDIDAAVYVINFDKPDKERYFVRLSRDSKHLIMLDKQRRIIDSKLNYKLAKK